jgi:hypothetical protein
MAEKFVDMLMVGGKSNSLGRTNEVIELVLNDRARLEELYGCLFHEDAWLRMRAADALEKICRRHPDWLVLYVDRLLGDFSTSTQPSIQWHLAQILGEVTLTDPQKRAAVAWLKVVLASKEADWIVAANAMDTLVQFAQEGTLPPDEVVSLLKVQRGHKSAAVIRRANKLLDRLVAT